MNSILYLDIDGILNSVQDMHNKSWIQAVDYTNWKPECVQLIDRLCLLTDCKIVISSSWRIVIYKTIEEWNEAFRQAGAIHIKVIGITPRSSNGFRGREINMWMAENNFIGPYVILDDDTDFFPNQFRVWVDSYLGLQYEHIEKAIKILEGQSLGLNLRCMEERNPPND